MAEGRFVGDPGGRDVERRSYMARAAHWCFMGGAQPVLLHLLAGAEWVVRNTAPGTELNVSLPA